MGLVMTYDYAFAVDALFDSMGILCIFSTWAGILGGFVARWAFGVPSCV